MNGPAKLYLIPVPIAAENPLQHIPGHNLSVLKTLRVFVAEDLKTARRHLKILGYSDVEKAEIFPLNEHSTTGDLHALEELLDRGEDLGLMSDAGCPAVADPGAELVKLAHAKNRIVVPLAGPSSVLMAVMCSGFVTQRFAFNSYLPVDRNDRFQKIRELEQIAFRYRQAQFFIETPYRNEQLFEALLATLKPDTSLFIGAGMGENTPFVHTGTVEEWKRKGAVVLNKRPAVWGIYPCVPPVEQNARQGGPKKRKFKI